MSERLPAIPNMPDLANDQQRGVLVWRAIVERESKAGTRGRYGNRFSAEALPEKTRYQAAWMYIVERWSVQGIADALGIAAEPQPRSAKGRARPRVTRVGTAETVARRSLAKWLVAVRERYDALFMAEVKKRADKDSLLVMGEDVGSLASRSLVTLAGQIQEAVSDKGALAAMDNNERHSWLRGIEILNRAVKDRADADFKLAQAAKLRALVESIDLAAKTKTRGGSRRANFTKDEVVGMFTAALLGDDPAATQSADAGGATAATPTRARRVRRKGARS